MLEKGKTKYIEAKLLQTATCMEIITKFSFLRSQTIRKEIRFIQSKYQNIFLVYPGMNYFIFVMRVRKIARSDY